MKIRECTIKWNTSTAMFHKVYLLIPLPHEQRVFPICNEFKVLMINSHDDESSRKREMYLFGGYAEIPEIGLPLSFW